MNEEEIAARNQEIYHKNKDKNFVQRILNPDKFPVMENPDGTTSSHQMASWEMDGKGIVAPTIFYDENTGKLFKPEDPLQEAMKRGEYIQFNDPQEAERFAANEYKIGTGIGKPKQNLKDIWASDYFQKYQQFDPEGSGYDYSTAETFGMGGNGEGENKGHWGSVAPVTPQEAFQLGLPAGTYKLLKGKNHPTWNKAILAEEMRGSEVVKIGDRYFSIPKKKGK